ncbi:MAG: hypothetical protein RSC41_04415, partial [Oscillospiraceae bacterium]
MQILYPLSDGSALDLTVAKYNPPKSPNFDKVGVKPDFEVTLTPEEAKNFDTLDETNDPQIIKAMEVIMNSGAKQTDKTDTSIKNDDKGDETNADDGDNEDEQSEVK